MNSRKDLRECGGVRSTGNADISVTGSGDSSVVIGGVAEGVAGGDVADDLCLTKLAGDREQDADARR